MKKSWQKTCAFDNNAVIFVPTKKRLSQLKIKTMSYDQFLSAMLNDEQVKLNINYSELVENHGWTWGSDEDKIRDKNPSFDHENMYLQVLSGDDTASLCAVTSENDSYIVIKSEDLSEENIIELLQFSYE